MQYGTIFSYLSHFGTAKSLQIINDFPGTIPAVAIGGSLPLLSNLSFRVKAFPATFQLTNFLVTTLEELYIRHDTGLLTSGLASEITLPKLRILGITSPGSSLFHWTKMPSIETIIFYGPQDLSHAQVLSGSVADSSYGRCLHLEFESWRRPEDEEVSLGVVAFFRDLFIKAQQLQTVKFAQCWVDGEALVTIMDTTSQAVDEDTLIKLEKVTLSHTTGITRNECDLLKTLIKKLTIYMW